MNHDMLPGIQFFSSNNNGINRSNLVVLDDSDEEDEEYVEEKRPRVEHQLTEEEQEELRKLDQIRNELIQTHNYCLPVDSISRLLADHEKYGNPGPDVAFHIDCWPPKPIGTSIVVETYPIVPAHFTHFFPTSDHIRIYERDCMIKTADEIKEVLFKETAQFQHGTLQMVVITDQDEDCARLADLLKNSGVEAFHFPGHACFDICPTGINRVLEDIRQAGTKVFICTWTLERRGGLIPFAKHTIVHKVDMHAVFMKSFATRHTERARLRKQHAFIDVKLGVFDNKKTARNLVELLYGREEYPAECEVSLLCHYFPSRDLVNLNTLTTLKALKQAERKDSDERLIGILGPHFENWWDDLEMLAKVEKHVKPEKEFPEHRQPLNRVPVCYAECAANLASLRYNLDDENCILPQNNHD